MYEKIHNRLIKESYKQLFRGRAVTKFTNLKPDPFAIYFVKLIYFNVNIYMGQ